MPARDFWLGKPERVEQIQRFTPQQQKVFQQMLGGAPMMQDVFANLQRILGGDVSEFQAPIMRQFQEEIVPGIAERFSGMGAGSQRSSAFQSQMGKAGERLSETLSAQRAGLQSQAAQQLQNILGMGLTPQFESIMRPEKKGFLEDILFALLQKGSDFASGMGKAAAMGML